MLASNYLLSFRAQLITIDRLGCRLADAGPVTACFLLGLPLITIDRLGYRLADAGPVITYFLYRASADNRRQIGL